MKKLLVLILGLVCLSAQDGVKPDLTDLKLDSIISKGDPIKLRGQTNLPSGIELTLRVISQRHELMHGKQVM